MTARRTPFHPDPSLLGRLGGAGGVHRLIDAFYDAIAADGELKPLFHDFHLRQGRERVKEFFVEWLGGPPGYSRTARTGMRRFHGHLFITPGLSERWLDHFGGALRQVGAPADAAAEVMAALRRLAGHVVNDLEERRPLIPRDLRCVRSRLFREPVARIAADDLPGLKAAHEDDPLLPKISGPGGRTLLWEAAWRGRLEIARFLLDRGSDPCEPGLSSTASRLDAVGADLMLTPLCAALWRGHRETADLLTSHGVRIDVHTAAFLGDLDELRRLLDADPGRVHETQGAEDVWPVTPLAHAVGAGRAGAAELLLSRGAEVRPHSRGLLDRAARIRRADLVKLLIDHGADPSQVIPGPWVVDGAIAGLLAAGAANIGDSRWVRLSCSADIRSRSGGASLARAFLDFGADVNAPQADGRYPLHAAAKAGFLETMELFLDRGARVDARDRQGETPLHHILKGGLGADVIAAMQLLLEAGADIDAAGDPGATVLHRAAARRDADAVAFLLLEGADTSRRDRRGRTPLDTLLAGRGRPEPSLVRLLTGFGSARAA